MNDHGGADSRYDRHAPLVNQQRLRDLNVRVQGTGPALSTVLAQLAHLGVATGSGVVELAVDDHIVDATFRREQFLLDSDSGGSPLAVSLMHAVERLNPEVRLLAAEDPPAFSHDAVIVCPTLGTPAAVQEVGVPVVVAAVTPGGIAVGSSMPDNPAPSGHLCGPILGCLAGALAVQEVLRLVGAVEVEPHVLASSLVVSTVLRGRRIGHCAEEVIQSSGVPHPALGAVMAQFAINAPHADVTSFERAGTPLKSSIRAVLSEDEILVESDLTGVHVDDGWPQVILRKAPRPAARPSQLRWEPLDEIPAMQSLTDESRLSRRSILIVGAGALGSWVATLLSQIGLANSRVTIVDMDDEVEIHNLNRQVLYTVDDLGDTKAEAAVRRLHTLDPSTTFEAIVASVDERVLDRLVALHQFSDDDPTGTDARSRIARAVMAADVIVACPDSLQTRWVLNVLAEATKTPLVNGATDGLAGRVHRVDPNRDDLCLVCRLGPEVRSNATRRSCQDLVGEVPVPSIGTASAVVAALQALLVVAALAGADLGVNWLSYDGTTGSLQSLLSEPRDAHECPQHLIEEPT